MEETSFRVGAREWKRARSGVNGFFTFFRPAQLTDSTYGSPGTTFNAIPPR